TVPCCCGVIVVQPNTPTVARIAMPMPARFMICLPSFVSCQTRHCDLEPERLQYRPAQPIGMLGVPPIQGETHFVERLSLEALRQPRQEALRVRGRSGSLVSRLDLNDVRDADEINLLELVRRARPVFAGHDRD